MFLGYKHQIFKLYECGPSNKSAYIVVPDYVTISYDCIIWTDYIEHMNKLIESINYASDSYWGNPERFNFRASINSFDGITELSQCNVTNSQHETRRPNNFIYI